MPAIAREQAFFCTLFAVDAAKNLRSRDSVHRYYKDCIHIIKWIRLLVVVMVGGGVVFTVTAAVMVMVRVLSLLLYKSGHVDVFFLLVQVLLLVVLLMFVCMLCTVRFRC